MSAQTSDDPSGTTRTMPPARFRHGPGAEPRGGPMQSLTRYLCAAAYLDKDFCDAVLKEYVYERHRAIVPSDGYDLEPVIRHARRARLLRIGRDALICFLWLALLIFATPFAVAYFLVVAATTYLRRANRRKIAVRVILVAVPLLLVLFVMVTLFPSEDGTVGSSDAPEVGALVPALVTVAASGLLTLYVLFTAIAVGHLGLVFRLLARDLAPGAHGPGPAAGGERFEQALRRVRASQSGNVTLYAGDNPFLGTGHWKAPDARLWSIVLELDRKGGGEHGAGTRPVDPWVMHERVRARLNEMRDETARTGKPPLPENERISGLVLRWHVAAPGECVQRTRPIGPGDGRPYSGHPLIDPTAWIPFSVATDAAVEALVRHPQAGIRAFQRVTVAGPGQIVRGPDGSVLAPAEEQDAVLTAFVHLAVEGRMLYGQFTATVLPPVRPLYKIVDVLPAWRLPTLLSKAVRYGGRATFTASSLAPSRLVRELWRMVRAALSADFADDPARGLVHDYGSRLSVRELAADTAFSDFFQELDLDKYDRLIERRVNEAVLDYLADECGIDVSAYRDQAASIMNNGVIMTGGSVSGQVAVGGRVEQKQPRINP